MTTSDRFRERTTKIHLLFVAVDEFLLLLGNSLKPLSETDKVLFKLIYKDYKLVGVLSNEKGEEYSYYQKKIADYIPNMEKIMLRTIGLENRDEIISEFYKLKQML